MCVKKLPFWYINGFLFFFYYEIKDSHLKIVYTVKPYNFTMEILIDLELNQEH